MRASICRLKLFFKVFQKSTFGTILFYSISVIYFSEKIWNLIIFLFEKKGNTLIPSFQFSLG